MQWGTFPWLALVRVTKEDRLVVRLFFCQRDVTIVVFVLFCFSNSQGMYPFLRNPEISVWAYTIFRKAI